MWQMEMVTVIPLGTTRVSDNTKGLTQNHMIIKWLGLEGTLKIT